MAVPRSPNYPSLTLGEAIDALRPVLKAEHRNKMSREVLARHLGYSSISGRALSKMGAIRAYGLIEGQGDETRVSHDGLICVEAPRETDDYREALRRCALRPGVFKEISQEFQTTPSEANLRFWVIKKGYNPEAAGKIVQNYLATMRLVADLGIPSEPSGDAPDAVESLVDSETLDARNRPRTETPLRAPPEPLLVGMRKFVINLSDGKDAILTYPAGMTAVGYQDLEDYLALFFKKAKRDLQAGRGRMEDDEDIA